MLTEHLSINFDKVFSLLAKSDNPIVAELGQQESPYPRMRVGFTDGCNEDLLLGLTEDELTELKSIARGLPILVVRMHCYNEETRAKEFVYSDADVLKALQAIRTEGQVPAQLDIVALGRTGWLLNEATPAIAASSVANAVSWSNPLCFPSV